MASNSYNFVNAIAFSDGTLMQMVEHPIKSVVPPKASPPVVVIITCFALIILSSYLVCYKFFLW